MPSTSLFSRVSALSSVRSEVGLGRGLLALGLSAVVLLLVGCETKETPKPTDQPPAQEAPPAEATPTPPVKATPSEDDSGFEVISTDKNKKTITFRDKQTGKTETLPMEAFYKRVSEREQAPAKNAPPPPGVKEVKPGDLPPWVTLYAGAEVINNQQAAGNKQFAGRVIMSTNDSPETVAGFYEKYLKDNDFQVVRTSSGKVQAVSARRNSGEIVMVSAQPNQALKKTSVMLNYMKIASDGK
ncbi:MAG: hypothetical protein ACUVR8_05885 [Acidobacteriota bacterium]